MAEQYQVVSPLVSYFIFFIGIYRYYIDFANFTFCDPTVVNSHVFLMTNPSCLLLVYRKMIDFGIFTSHIVTFLMFQASRITIICIVYIKYETHYKRTQFHASVSICISFITFSHIPTLTKTSDTKLKRSSEQPIILLQLSVM